MAEGNLPAARKAYAESLTIFRELAARDPSNAEAKRDLSISLEKLGDVNTAEGNLPEARKAYEEGLSIRRELSARDPSNAQAKRDVMVSLWRLVSIHAPGYSWQLVLDALLDMKAHGQLTPSDEWMIADVKDQLAKEQAETQKEPKS